MERVSAIEQYYNEDQSPVNRKKAAPHYWFNKGRMSADTVCDLLHLNRAWFNIQAEIYGNQTAKMIQSGEIEVPEESSKIGMGKRKNRVNLNALMRSSGLSYGCIHKRYANGLRGEDLVAPIDKCRRRR